MSDYVLVLDASVPIGELKMAGASVLANPESDIRDIVAAYPGITVSLVPRFDNTPTDASAASQG